MLGSELFLFLINTVIITALLSALVLWRYRVAVLTGMRVRAGAALVMPAPIEHPSQPATGEIASAALAWERATHRRVVQTYLLSLGPAALLLAWVYLVQSGPPPTLAQLAADTGVMMSCAAPMVALSLAWPWWRGVRFAIIVLSVTAVATTLLALIQRILSARMPDPDQLLNVVRVFELAGVILAFPFLLLLASGTSKLRGVAPATFAALIVFGLAPFAASHLNLVLGETQAGSAYLMATVNRFGLHATFLLIALPAGWIAWGRLHAVARAYAAKRFSDAQLLARIWWLMFVAQIGFELVNAGAGPVFTLAGCIGAYVAFLLTSPWLFRWSGLSAGRDRPRTLLLLRVFGYTARTERLFDRLGARWRYFGPVSVIAAPDVIARTIDPGNFLGWLTGSIDEGFVRSQADLDRKLARFDTVADPDGRYRVNQFSCRDDTWRATVVSLMDRADAVVMDLRGLTSARGGCEFELEQLARRVQPSRVVLVIDEGTEQEMISRTLGDLQPRIRTIRVQRGNQAGIDAVFSALLQAAG